MSVVSINSASARFTGAYAGYMTKFEPEKRELDFSNAVRLDVGRIPYEDGWRKLWGAETAEAAAEDGTVTQTASGRVNMIGANGFHYRGGAAFCVSVTFDSSGYEEGRLSGLYTLQELELTAAGVRGGLSLKV